jgi:hypothetical protein
MNLFYNINAYTFLLIYFILLGLNMFMLIHSQHMQHLLINLLYPHRHLATSLD